MASANTQGADARCDSVAADWARTLPVCDGPELAFQRERWRAGQRAAARARALASSSAGISRAEHRRRLVIRRLSTFAYSRA